MKGVRITLKSRAETAAAAIVQRMIIRKRPLVVLLVVPRNKGSTTVAATMTANCKITIDSRKSIISSPLW